MEFFARYLAWKHMIETINLTKYFDGPAAVDSVSFTVDKGSVFGLLGPNGAGKTTTIRMLTTLLAPSSGTAKVAGFDVTAAPLSVKKSIGVVPQMINPGSSEAPNQLLSSSQQAERNQLQESKSIYVAEDGTRWKLLKKPKVESRLNAYLLNHQDLSPSGNIKGIMPYATFVSYDENKQ